MGGARGFTLRSYGDAVFEGSPVPIPSIGASFPVWKAEDYYIIYMSPGLLNKKINCRI